MFDVFSRILAAVGEGVGLLGAATYCVCYMLVALGKLTSQTGTYYILNMLAAGMVLFSLSFSFNLASVIIQIFFVTMSLIGFVKHLGPQVSCSNRSTKEKN